MMKTEFEKLIHAEEGSLKSEVWDMVEAVYLDHPSINNTDGKQQMANIFLMPGGMEILKDMHERVMALRHCENVLKTIMDELQHEYSVRAAEIEAVNDRHQERIESLESHRAELKRNINDLKGRKQ